MAGEPAEITLPPQTEAARAAAYRRPVFVAILLIGLVLFIVWLPNGTRAYLSAALRVHWVLISMLVFFALIALSLVWTAGQRLDTAVFLFLNLHGYRKKWLDRVMWLATQIGNMVTALLLAAIFFVLRYHGLAFMIILGTLTLWLTVESIKALTNRARPSQALKESRVVGWREPGRSFPSGHTSQTFFLATLLSLTPLRQDMGSGLGVPMVLYIVAVLVGFTRIYVGAHYPRDVMGGAMLGAIWGLLATLVDPFLSGLRLVWPFG